MVLIFIFATAGLLIWAAVKPWVGKWVEVRWDEGASCVIKAWANVLCRVRESAGAIYPFLLKAIHEGAVGVSMSGFRLAGHLDFDVAQRWRWDMGMFDTATEASLHHDCPFMRAIVLVCGLIIPFNF